MKELDESYRNQNAAVLKLNSADHYTIVALYLLIACIFCYFHRSQGKKRTAQQKQNKIHVMAQPL